MMKQLAIYNLFKKMHFELRFFFGIIISIIKKNKRQLPHFFLEVVLQSNDKILILVPHFDDEILGCSSIIYRCAMNNINLTIVYITDSQHGGMNFSRSKSNYSIIRQNESINALQILNKNLTNIKINYLNIEDKDTFNNIDYITNKLLDYEFNIIFIPFENDPHPDHSSLYKVSDNLLEYREFTRYEYFVHSQHHSFENITHFSYMPFYDVVKALYKFKSQVYIDFEKELINRRIAEHYYTYFKIKNYKILQN